MKEYIISVCVGVMISVVVNLLIPSPRYMGIMKIVCGLIVVSTLISPIKNIAQRGIGFTGNKYNAYESDFEYRIEQSKEEFEKSMVSKIKAQSFNQISADIGKLWNSNITVSLNGDSLSVENAKPEEYEAIRKFVKDKYGLNTVFR